MISLRMFGTTWFLASSMVAPLPVVMIKSLMVAFTQSGFFCCSTQAPCPVPTSAKELRATSTKRNIF
jgi:hypothetical protein